VVVVQTAPAVRVTISEAFGMAPGQSRLEQLVRLPSPALVLLIIEGLPFSFATLTNGRESPEVRGGALDGAVCALCWHAAGIRPEAAGFPPRVRD